MGTLELLGWGLVLIVVAIGILAGITWRRKLSLLIFHWNQWLGGIAFILAIWGILALFPGQGELRQASLGGNVGLKIIAQQNVIGILRILGLVIVGIVLVAPGASFRLAAGFISWLGHEFERRPAPIPVPPQEPQLPPAAVTPKPPPKIKPERETAPSTVTTPSQAQQELTGLGKHVVLGVAPDSVPRRRIVGGDVKCRAEADGFAARQVSTGLAGAEGDSSRRNAVLEADARHKTRLDEELLDDLEQFESWSQICLEALFRRHAL